MTVRLIFKYFGKQIMSWAGKKMMQRFMQKAGQNSGQPFGFNPFESQQNNSSGKTTIDSNVRAPSNNEKKVVGEYVDYEEID